MNFDRAAQLLGLDAPSFAAWRAVVAGAFAEHLAPEQHAQFHAIFGRDPPSSPCRELWLAAGRRAGKDYVATRVAVFLALFRHWTLAPGETGVVLLLAVDRAQAKVAFNYVRGCLEAEPLLWAEVAGITADTITLRNGIEVQVGTSDYAAVRGRTIVAAILDEFAFWPADAATEVLRALRPGMASQPAAMLLVISSAYATHGAFYDAFRRYYGTNDPRVLFGRATTRDLNPTIDEAFIADELARDPVGAAAEYLSQFRSDVAGFIDAALLDSVTRREPRELPFIRMSSDGGAYQYFAGLDVSGGRGDAAACAIARVHRERVQIVATRRWPAPHDPLFVAQQVAEFLASYGLSSAVADHYAAEFATSVYREAGVTLHAAEVNRSEAYLHLLPLLTTGRIELPDDPALRAELIGLERRTGRAGKDSIDHPPHGHDDHANSVALAAWHATRALPSRDLTPALLAGATLALPSTEWDGLMNPTDFPTALGPRPPNANSW
jgi:hypothetical protein